MDEWRTPIRCYVSPAGNNKIREWYDQLSVQERSDADAFLLAMRKTKEWLLPDYRLRLKNGGGTGELRWVSGKKQHRLIGFFHGGSWLALIGCTHKQQVYDPAEALETARKRKADIESGKAKTVDYDF